MMRQDIIPDITQDITQGQFYNPSRGNLSFSQLIQEIFDWMGEKPELAYEIVVGCDSASGQNPFFPVVVVVLRKKHGGRIFLRKMSYSRQFHTWKERILQEVFLSCELALSLKEALAQKMGQLAFAPNFEFKYIHADVGEGGATKDMIKEVIGVIQGNGFEAKIKPEAYVASSVADRYT